MTLSGARAGESARAPRPVARRGLGRALTGAALSAPPVLVILLFVGLPMVAAVLYTLGLTGGLNSTIAAIAQHQHVSRNGAPTLAAWHEVLTDPQFLASLWATVYVTVLSTAITIALAWFLALYLRFHDNWVSRAVSALSVVPMFIPAVIGAYAVLTFWAPNGFFRTMATQLGWSHAPTFGYTLGGVIIGSVWSNLPFAVLMIVSGLQGVPAGLIDAARDVDAGPVRRFWTVLLPLTSVPTIIATTFTAIGILGSFTLPYIVGPTGGNILGPVMSNSYTAFNTPQQAQVMAVVVFVLAALAGIPYVWANFRSGRNTATPRGGR
ncbi:MAG TPA: ABC transporter permease subunit [Gryllotalpicola sp.]